MKPGAIPAYPSMASRSPANLAFSALLFCFLGWAILELWTVGAHAGLMPHLINALACAPVMGCSLRRFHVACPPHLRAGPAGRRKAGKPALALPFVVGAAFGAALAGGSLILLALLSAGSCCLPWTRSGVHRQRLPLSFLALATGAALPLLAAGARPLAIMVALPAAWCLWTVAALLCICLCSGELLKKKA